MARPRKKIVEDYEAGEQVDLHKLAEATKVEPLEEPKRKVAKGEIGRAILNTMNSAKRRA